MTAASVMREAQHGRAKLYCYDTDPHPIYPNSDHPISILDQDERYVIGLLLVEEVAIVVVVVVAGVNVWTSFSFSMAWICSSFPTGPHNHDCYN